MTDQAAEYRVIQCSEDYGLVIAVTPADATPDTQNATFYRCADWLIIAGEPADQFHEITRHGAIGYFSGHADGLGYGILPDHNFPTLDAVLTFRDSQRNPPSAVVPADHAIKDRVEIASRAYERDAWVMIDALREGAASPLEPNGFFPDMRAKMLVLADQRAARLLARMATALAAIKVNDHE